MTTKALTKRADFEPVVSLVVDGLTSPHGRRAYGQALADFLATVATARTGARNREAARMEPDRHGGWP